MDSNAGGDDPTDARDLTARLTLHSGSDTTARDEASERVESALEGVTGWRIEGVEIVEPPAAPFEPHTLEVGVAVDSRADDDVGGAVADALVAEGMEVVPGR